MAKITSKYQVTIPKALADEHRLKPGDDIEWSSTGDAIRIRRPRKRSESTAQRLKSFDDASGRQQRRQKGIRASAADRGWTREDLYKRGRSR